MKKMRIEVSNEIPKGSNVLQRVLKDLCLCFINCTKSMKRKRSSKYEESFRNIYKYAMSLTENEKAFSVCTNL